MGVIIGILGVLKLILSSDYSFCRPTGHVGHGGHDLNDGILPSPYLLKTVIIWPIFHKNEDIRPP